MTFITKKALPRRTFLAGCRRHHGVADARRDDSRIRRDITRPTPRLGFVYVGNGIVHRTFRPRGEGADFELSPVLRPLAPLRDQLTVISGLDHAQAENFGDGTGDHPRSSAAWLTGVHAWDRTRPGVEVKLATSADQLAADVLGRETPVRSLELAVDTATQSACDAGDCFYINTVSWRSETTPNLTENHPRVVFERLFGDGGSSAERLARTKKTSSILDSVRDEANRLAADVGHGDRTKLGEYLDSVREIEQRIQGVETSDEHSIALPDRPTGIPASFDEHTKLMLDLQLLAFQTDTTRVFSMILAREVSNRSYPNIGVPDQHHPVSHHRNDPSLIEKKTKIDAYHISLLALPRGKNAGDAGRRRHAARPESPDVWRRHGRRQPAPPFRPAVRTARQVGREDQGGSARRVSGGHADDEHAAHDARQGRRARRRHRRQHRAARSRTVLSDV